MHAPTIKDSLVEILKIAWLPVVTMFFNPLYIAVNVAVCGRMGDTELAGFGLGSLTNGIFLLSTCSSFCLGLGTLVAQASGAKDFRLCRIYLYRQYFLNTLFYPVVCFPMIFIRQIYSLIGQDPQVALYASRYLWIVMPSIYFHI